MLDTSYARKVAEEIKKDGKRKAAGGERATATSQAAALEAEGVRYLQAKDSERARVAFHAALQVDTARPTTLHQLGIAWFEAADVADTAARRVARDLAWESAGVAWKRAVELEPNDAKLLVAIGEAQRDYYAREGTEAFKAALGAAARLDPRNTEAAYGLGLCFARLTENPIAMAQYRRLKALNKPDKARVLLEEMEKDE